MSLIVNFYDKSCYLFHRLVKVNNVSKQVVAGMSYTINGIFEDGNKEQFQCSINIWERPWEPEPDNLIITIKTKENYTAEEPLIEPTEEASLMEVR